MKLTFMISASGKIHLIQHDTKMVKRPHLAKTSEVNGEREWERYKAYRPDVIDRFTPIIVGTDIKNKLDPPTLVGVLVGAVQWYEGVEVESWMREDISNDSELTNAEWDLVNEPSDDPIDRERK